MGFQASPQVVYLSPVLIFCLMMKVLIFHAMLDCIKPQTYSDVVVHIYDDTFLHILYGSLSNLYKETSKRERKLFLLFG